MKSSAEIEAIRVDYFAGVPVKEMLYTHGISVSTLRNIRIRKGWHTRNQRSDICPRCKTNPKHKGGYCHSCRLAYDQAYTKARL